jgi:hypothetical protein
LLQFQSDHSLISKQDTQMNPFLTEKVVKATWDIPNHPSFTGGALAAGSYSPNDGNISIPSGAIITDVIVDVETTCVTAGADAGTAALGYTGATGAFVAAISVVAAGDVWDAGVRGTLVRNPALTGNAATAIVVAASDAASMIKTGGLVNLLLTTAVEDFTAGKISVYVKYIS